MYAQRAESAGLWRRRRTSVSVVTLFSVSVVILIFSVSVASPKQEGEKEILILFSGSVASPRRGAGGARLESGFRG